ncbi:MAG: hypothetical protein QXU79_01590 [Candidatus Micrarchaeaceae archaeon]
MAAIKPLDTIVQKWTRVTPGRQEDYRTGVQNPRVDWAQATMAAEDTWGAGVQAAIANDTWLRGIRTAGTQAWQNGCLTLGVQRWAQGVQAAGDRYRQGFAPYAQVIQRTQLPPRGAKGDPANIERVRVIAQALHQAKITGPQG